jgi:apolipoprotein D and lipocalin family protein
MKILQLLPFISVAFLISACFRETIQLKSLVTVSNVELSRYAGTWYEIARYPNRFQKGCRNTTATYTPMENGDVNVLNRCSTDSGEKTAHGTAKVVDPQTNARLKVTFFWPFYGDYWIIDLGEDYEYAVVGTPDRKYLWLLSRTPVMDEQLYNDILERIKLQGFDPAKLLKTEHPQG